MVEKEYKNPRDLIKENCPDVLRILTGEECDYLYNVLDYECIVLRLHNGLVDIVDTISGDILNTENLYTFVRESVLFAIHDCAEE